MEVKTALKELPHPLCPLQTSKFHGTKEMEHFGEEEGSCLAVATSKNGEKRLGKYAVRGRLVGRQEKLQIDLVCVCRSVENLSSSNGNQETDPANRSSTSAPIKICEN